MLSVFYFPFKPHLCYSHARNVIRTEILTLPYTRAYCFGGLLSLDTIYLSIFLILKGNGNKTTVKIDINRGTVAVNNPDQSKGVPPKTFTFGAYRSKIKERLRVFGVCS